MTPFDVSHQLTVRVRVRVHSSKDSFHRTPPLDPHPTGQPLVDSIAPRRWRAQPIAIQTRRRPQPSAKNENNPIKRVITLSESRLCDRGSVAEIHIVRKGVSIAKARNDVDAPSTHALREVIGRLSPMRRGATIAPATACAKPPAAVRIGAVPLHLTSGYQSKWITTIVTQP